MAGRCCGACDAAGAGRGVLAQPREVFAQAWANSVLKVVFARANTWLEVVFAQLG